jgi:FAD:protein FMN transferase
VRRLVTLAALAVLAASPAVPAALLAEVPASSGQASSGQPTEVPASSGQAIETVERRLTLMGTEAGVVVTADDRPAALAASEAAVRALEAAEERLSTWPRPGREESELARLNAAPVGRPVPLSPELGRELAAAEACRRVTDGAFGAGVGPLVDAWGLRTGGRQPEPEELRAALSASTGEVIAFHGDGTATRRRAGSRIEEGGFGKGAALDAAREALAAHPAVRSARIDLGGQVLFVGEADGEIAVAHPEHRERPVLGLAPEALAGRSAATSGNSERGILVDGRRLSHLLDPRTGHPAADVGSVTVLARSALAADCLSTGLYVLAARDGVGAALAVAEEAGADAAFVRPGSANARLDVVATPGLAGRLRVLDPVAVRTVRIGGSPAEFAGMEWNEAGAGGAEALEADRAIPRSD